MREHRAFGDASRAARVLKYGNVVHADGRVHRGRARLRARDEVFEEVDPRPGGYLRDRGMGFLPLQLERREQVEREPQVLGDPRDHVVRDRQLRAVVLDLLVEGEVRHNRDAAAGVLPLVLQLARGVQRIRQHGLGTEPQGRVIGDDRLGQVRQLNGDPLIFRDAERGQRGSQAIHLLLELAVREPAVQEHDGDRVGMGGRRALEELRQRQVFERRLAGNAGIVVLEPGPIMHCAGGRSPLQHTGARMSRKGRRNAVLERRKRGSTISAFGVAYTRREPHR